MKEYFSALLGVIAAVYLIIVAAVWILAATLGPAALVKFCWIYLLT